MVYGIIAIILLSIVVPYIYVMAASGFSSDVLSRLVCADFSMSPERIFDLVIGYTVGGLVFAYLFFQIYKNLFLPIDPAQIPYILSGSAITFCYLARIITHKRGYIYGKQYLTAVIIAGAAFYSINTFSTIGKYLLSDASISLTYLFSIDCFNLLYQNMLDRATHFLIFIKSTINYLFIGAVGTSMLGESFLLLCGVDNRPLPAILEKFSSDFITLSGNGVTDKLKEMTSMNRDVTSIKVVSRSLYTFEIISDNIEKHACRLKDKNHDENYIPDFKIIAPENYDAQFHYSWLKQPLNVIINKFTEDNLDTINTEISQTHNTRLEKLKNLVNKKEINWKPVDMKNFRIVIANCTTCGNVLIITDAGGRNSEKCALYSQEPYLVSLASNVFDDLFKIS